MSEAYLIHWGVDGQKWGRRNYQNEDGSYKPGAEGRYYHYIAKNPYGSQKSNPSGNKNKTDTQNKNVKKRTPSERQADIKKALLIGVAAAGLGAAAYYAYKNNVVSEISTRLAAGVPVSEKDVAEIAKETLDDLKVVIAKQGSEIYRIEGRAGFDVSKVDKPLYVTTKKSDHATYMKYLRDWAGTGEKFSETMLAKKDIVAPSDKEARRLFDEFFKNNEQYQKDLFDTLVDTYKKLGASDEYAKQKATNQMKNPFDAGIYAIVKNRGDAKSLINMYMSKGYNAILDYHDIKDHLTQKPAIIFEAYADLINKSEKKVTTGMLREATTTLINDLNAPMRAQALIERRWGLA